MGFWGVFCKHILTHRNSSTAVRVTSRFAWAPCKETNCCVRAPCESTNCCVRAPLWMYEWCVCEYPEKARIVVYLTPPHYVDLPYMLRTQGRRMAAGRKYA